MRYLFILLAFALAACTGSSTDVPAQITAVQKATVSACAFLPTATVIANIFLKNASGLTSVSQVATAVCQAVKPAVAALVATAPEVAGVPIEGDFVTVEKKP